MRRLLTERYRERLAGVLSCYDRIIVTGTLPGACYAKGMMGFLSARQIRVFDYPRFDEPLRDRVRDPMRTHACESKRPRAVAVFKQPYALKRTLGSSRWPLFAIADGDR